VQQLLAVGLGLALGVTNVFFRDVAQIVGVAVQFWFWLTPIVYPIGAVPERVRKLVTWNPLYGLVTSYQGIVVEHRWPSWDALWPTSVMALVVVVLAGRVFRTLSPAMVDEL
jgi:lipopolysaccharide transport system permease protein